MQGTPRCPVWENALSRQQYGHRCADGCSDGILTHGWLVNQN